MSPVTPTKNSLQKDTPLQSKMKSSQAVDKQIILEQRKEIARLQNLLAKAEVKHQSEVSALKAKLKQKNSPIKIIIGDAVKHGA